MHYYFLCWLAIKPFYAITFFFFKFGKIRREEEIDAVKADVKAHKLSNNYFKPPFTNYYNGIKTSAYLLIYFLFFAKKPNKKNKF